MAALRKKHQNTLIKLFTSPVTANIKWAEIESLIKVLGAKSLKEAVQDADSS